MTKAIVAAFVLLAAADAALRVVSQPEPVKAETVQ